MRLLQQNKLMSFFYKRPIVVLKMREIGEGFVFSRSFSPVSMEVEHVIMGGMLLIKAWFEQFSVVFINVSAPTNGTERKLFLEKITDELNSCNSKDYLFLGGDFNCTKNATLDRNDAEPHPASQHALRQLVYSHGLVDVWRRTHADC